MLNVVVVGAGQIAEAHIIEIGRLNSARVVGLCDLFQSTLDALSAKHDIPHTNTSLTELLAESKPDVVHITTPPSTHLDIAKVCLESGAHVYIEKPLAVTAQQTESLIGFASSANRLVCLGANRTRSDAQRTAAQAIASGELGTLTHVSAMFSYDLHGIFGKQVISNPDHWIAHLPGQVFQNNIDHILAFIVPYLSDDLQIRSWATDRSAPGLLFDEIRLEILDREKGTTCYIVFTANVKPGVFQVDFLGTKSGLFVDCVSDLTYQRQSHALPGTLGAIFGLRKTGGAFKRRFWRRLFNFTTGRQTFFHDMQSLFVDFYAAITDNGAPPIPYDQLLRSARIVDEVISQIGHPLTRPTKE